MKTNKQFHHPLLAVAARGAALVLALASASIASAQLNNTTNGPNAVTTNGTNAGAGMTTGGNNSAYGFSALQKNTTGGRNTAVGSLTLTGNLTGNYNTAVGYGALRVSVASSNTALGHQALYKNTTGGFNVAIGDGALQNNTTGNGNIGIGEDGGFALTDGDNNICIGNVGVAGESGVIRIGTAQTDTYLTGVIHGDGSGLTGVPTTSLTGTITSAQIGTGAVTNAKIASAAVTSAKLAANLSLAGNLTLPATTAGAGAILVGSTTFLHSFGTQNVFVGLGAGNLTMTGFGNNTASGYAALSADTTGYNNTASGATALKANTTGYSNTATGASVLYKNTGGFYNTASGINALYSNTMGNYNTASGGAALYFNSTGNTNTAFGNSALNSNQTGSNNTAVGGDALINSTASGNIALGRDAGRNLTTGGNNIDIGNNGLLGEANTIRIGTPGTHLNTFLAGVIHGDGSGLTNVPAASVTGQVSTAQIANAAVTTAKLAANLTLGGTTTATFTASGDSDMQGKILKNPALGMLLYHPSYGEGAIRTNVSTNGQGDGVLHLEFWANGVYSEIHGASLGMSTPLDKPGTFISARAGLNGATPTAQHVFYIIVHNGFGFKGVGTALKGVTKDSGLETEVDLGTALPGGTFVNLLAVRRTASVEFYVDGVLKGSSSTNLPSSSTEGYVLRAQNSGTTANSTSLVVGFLTIGILMF